MKIHYSKILFYLVAFFTSIMLVSASAQAVKPSKAQVASKSQKGFKKYKVKEKVTRYSKKISRPEIVLPSPNQRLDFKFIKSFNSPTDQGIEKVSVELKSSQVRLMSLPIFNSSYRGRIIGLTQNQDFILYTIDSDLQEYVNQIIDKVISPHVAVVAIEPSSGKILAMAGKSSSLKDVALHSGFPAASLIKSITAATAVEHGGMNPYREFFFRGGIYELGPNNYSYSPSDKNSMSAAEALGKSCNPVFSRMALTYLNPSLLRAKINSFGFNKDISADIRINTSYAEIPNSDYEFGRTAAGFGDVYISPLHAALIMSSFANKGTLLRPALIDKIISQNGQTLYQFKPQEISRPISTQTASKLMQMMVHTTVTGTSRKEFLGRVNWDVAGKTGTLRGQNPKGLNQWFIGSAPVNNPQIAVAVISLDPGTANSKPSHIARLIMQRYLG